MIEFIIVAALERIQTVCPNEIPDWVAPLLDPYCREMTFWPALSCSSEKFLTFFSASFGPIPGFPKLWAYMQKLKLLLLSTIKLQCDFTFLPSDCKQITTEFKFWRSQRSTVWNVSWTGTPKPFAASKNAEMFSMHLNAILLSLIFLIFPVSSELTSLHKITPSLRTS